MTSVFELPTFSLDLTALEKLPNPVGDFSKHDASLRSKFRSAVGFYSWPSQISDAEINKMKVCAEDLRKHSEGALLIGIGGSYLGAKCLMEALGNPEHPYPLQWLSNVDYTSIRAAHRFAKRRKTAAVVISKSGGTTETLSGFFALAGDVDKSLIVAITDPSTGELRRLSKKHGWTAFDVPPNIGGRFSVFTPVGLFPLLLAGIDTDRVLSGARAMHKHLESLSPAQNPAYRYAAAKHVWDAAGFTIQVLMPYESSLKYVGDWYVQLWAESLGKEGKGPTPLPALGTSDQHSMLQLFKDGPRNKIVGFVDVYGKSKTPVGHSEFASEEFKFLTKHSFEEINHHACLATQRSLANSGVPTYRFHFPEVTPEALGAFLFFQMTACAFGGELYHIDAFVQPGVEEAKTLLRSSL